MKPRNLLLILLAAGFCTALFMWRKSPPPALRETTVSKDEKAEQPTPASTVLSKRTGVASAAAPDAALSQISLKTIEVFSNWMANNSAALESGSLDAATLAEGLRLAGERRPVMLQWMRQDPRAALESSVTWSQWAALPKEIESRVEEPFSAKGDFRFTLDCQAFAPQTPSPRPREDRYSLTHEGQVYEVHPYGRRLGALSKAAMPVQGIRLGVDAALWDQAITLVPPADLAAVEARYAKGNPPGISWVTGEKIIGEPTTALVGEKVYHFASEPELQVVAESFAKAEAMPGYKNLSYFSEVESTEIFDTDAFLTSAQELSAASTTGVKNLLMMRVICSDQPESEHPYGGEAGRIRLEEALQRGSDMMRDNSFGKTYWNVTVTDVLTLDDTKYYYSQFGNPQNNRDRILENAKSKASAANYDITQFDIFGVWCQIDPSAQLPVAGNANANRGIFEFVANGEGLDPENGQDATDFIVTHELGHSYGLGHANKWLPFCGGWNGDGYGHHAPPIPSFTSPHLDDSDFSEEHVEYGDIFDLMGASGRTDQYGNKVFPNGHFSPSSKSFLNWFESGDTVDISRDGANASGIYRVYCFDHRDALNSPGALALRVTADSNGDGTGEELWVALRRNFRNGAPAEKGAYITWAYQQGTHRLLDTRPLSAVDAAGDLLLHHRNRQTEANDAPLSVGESWLDPSGTVQIRNLGFGGVDPYTYLDIEILYDFEPPLPNFEVKSNKRYVFDSPLHQVDENDWRFSQEIDFNYNHDFPGFLTVGKSGGRLTGEWNFYRSYDVKEDVGDTFSAQWEGELKVNRPVIMALIGNNCCRMWIDVNRDDAFTEDEKIDNGPWGTLRVEPVRGRGKLLTPLLPTEAYKYRIQYVDGLPDPLDEYGNPILNNFFTLTGIPVPLGTWVDFAHTGTETGAFATPYNTMAEGITHVPSNGTLNVKPGTTSEKPVIPTTKPFLIKSFGGEVRIGD